VPGRVDHVQRVGGASHLPRHPHRLGLDRDPALPLDVHPVEVLRPHGPFVDHAGELQHAIGERGLAVVDVRDDAEVAEQLGPGGGRRDGLRELCQGKPHGSDVWVTSSHAGPVRRNGNNRARRDVLPHEARCVP